MNLLFLKNKYFFLIIIVPIIFNGCSDKPNVSDINVDLKVIRFDKEIIKFGQSKDTFKAYKRLQTMHPSFMNDFTRRILTVGNPNNPRTINTIYSKMAASPQFSKLADSVNIIFKDIDKYTAQIKKGYQYYKYYFPHINIDTLYYYISDFSELKAAIGTGYSAIPLNMYLGKSFHVYHMINPPFPQYFINTFEKKYLAPTHFKAIAQGYTSETNDHKNLLEEIISQGKSTYFTHKLLPNVPKNDLLGYTKDQWKWCEKEQKNIWIAFVKKKLFYSNEIKTIQRFIAPAPFTNFENFPQKTPAQIGIYVGYKIVESYMKKNTQISLKELMNEKDETKIFKKSGYRPI